MITIVDYKVGNLGSIQNMLKKLGEKSIVTSDQDEISEAKKLILPGIGAFDSGVNNLKTHNLWDVLNKKVLNEKTPILGICLGMQLLCNGSEEGNQDGLGWIDAEVKKFKFTQNRFKTPHIGWNYTHLKNESKLFENMYENPKFYFVHSYYVEASDDSSLTKTNYSFDFDSSVERENILGVQFHPEKSHKYGMKLLTNFINNY